MHLALDNYFNQHPYRYSARSFQGRTPYVYNLNSLEPVNIEVDAIRPEVEAYLPKYTKIRDCLLGEDHIKSLGETYLPRPSADRDAEEDRRYQNYVLRATFLNATGFTQRTTVGKLFAKPATIDLPPALMPLLENVNGEGLAFDQMIEQLAGEVFAFGRGGLYADFNSVSSGVVSMADVVDLSPTLTFVRAEDIINWRIDKRTRRVVMVVVREYYETFNEFSVTLRPQYKVFKLDPNLVVEVWRPQSPLSIDTTNRYDRVSQEEPMLPGRRPWTVIPFAIIGSANNDWTIDEAPLYSIANYDIALFRNSADIEEAAFLVGQPTPYIAGMKQSYANQLGITQYKWGSGKFLPLPDSTSKVGLVQASAETMLDRLIEDKQKILRQLGATIFSVDTLSESQTATGSVYQALQVHAPLVTTSRNVISGVRKALGYAAMFLGIDPESEDIKVKLNSDILDITLGLAGLQTTIQLYQAGVLTFFEMREQMRIQGLVLHDPEEAETILQEYRSKLPPLTINRTGSGVGAGQLRNEVRPSPGGDD